VVDWGSTFLGRNNSTWAMRLEEQGRELRERLAWREARWASSSSLMASLPAMVDCCCCSLR